MLAVVDSIGRTEHAASERQRAGYVAHALQTLAAASDAH
jgi:hypothetical protein